MSSLHRSLREPALWGVAALLGAILFAVAGPRVFPMLPEWTTTRAEAREIALGLLRDLGEPVEKPYLVVSTRSEAGLEVLLQRAARAGDARRIEDHPVRGYLLHWATRVYPPGAPTQEWAYRGSVGRDGTILALERRFPEDAEGTTIDAAEARRRARETLERYGFDLAVFDAPVLRTREHAARTDTAVRFPWRDQPLAEEVRLGIEVRFAGADLAGFSLFTDEPDRSERQVALQPLQLLSVMQLPILFLLVPLLAIPFLRRYHAGEVGVGRGLQLAGVTFLIGAFVFVLGSRVNAEGWSIGVLTRQQTTWIATTWNVAFYTVLLALVVFCAWSVGESWCRERWSGKLAAFDSLIKGKLANATVARSAWRGTAAGVLVAGAMAALIVAARSIGVTPIAAHSQSPLWDPSPWGGVALLGFLAVHILFVELVSRLFLVPLTVRRMGLWAGGAVAALGAVLIYWGGPIAMLPVRWTLLESLLYAAVAVIVFLVWDLLTVVVMNLVSTVMLVALPLLLAAAPAIQLQGWIALLGAALPMLLTVRHLGSAGEIRYHYDDIPAHVRRIAERERQKVELDTARSIQSSILPDLPPQLNGIEVAHAYLPASEVGGDFYDAMALEDGRLALAVGDVAGHGASSGLVMAMAKSALAVQSAVDADIDAVFATLNRIVYQSARRRLLTTLCYALIDPVRREMLYASAGHLFPYRVTAAGRVHALESVAYPLGVRPQLEVQSRVESLAGGDLIVLFSDGVVEARREGSDELFGFARLEEVLREAAGATPGQARQAILDAVEAFRGSGPRDDDLTLLVVKVP